MGQSSRRIEDLSPNQIRVIIKWERKGDGTGGTQEHTLDTNYATLRWRVTQPDEDVDYVGERKGKMLLLKGRSMANPSIKGLKSMRNRFTTIPQWGLRGLSGREKRR